MTEKITGRMVTPAMKADALAAIITWLNASADEQLLAARRLSALVATAYGIELAEVFAALETEGRS